MIAHPLRPSESAAGRIVGFDSLLIVDRGASDADASYRVLNADGGEAEQCGNGARCIASYLTGADAGELTLASLGGPVRARVLGDGRVSVNLGEPDFDPSALPFDAHGGSPPYVLALPSGEVRFYVVSMGNPHAVIAVDSVDHAPVGILGAELSGHRDFPQGVNVGFAERIDAGRLRLRVHERGVGETRACGTGAAAAAAIGRLYDGMDASIDVRLPGGVLSVSWQGPGSDLWQTGEATRVYEGQIEL